MDEERRNLQADPHETANPPDVNERQNPLQTIGQTVTGLSALAIMALIATPIVLVVVCVALVILTRAGR